VRVERLKDSKVTVQPLERHAGQPLLDEVRVLSAYLRVRHNDGSGILFTSSHGGVMHRSTFFWIWRECARRAGLPSEKQHLHVAKHTLGSLLGFGLPHPARPRSCQHHLLVPLRWPHGPGRRGDRACGVDAGVVSENAKLHEGPARLAQRYHAVYERA
jgi:hypothetical protein